MMRRILRVLLLTTTFGSLPQLLAGDLRITLPKRSNPTPVQALNQQGVNEVRKHHLEKAEKLFYRAYLIDPDDPFTLNNLGYISELEGNVERAQRYYQLAARQNSETTIDRASEDELKGRQLTQFTGAFGNRELQINRGNVEAMSLIWRKPSSTTARPRTCTPRKKLLWRSTAAGGVNLSVTWLRGTQKQSATGWRRRRAPRTKSRG